VEVNWQIYLLWTAKERKHILWFADKLKKLTTLAANPTIPLTINLTIHVTDGNSSEESDVGREELGIETMEKYDDLGTIHHHRPNLLEWFWRVKELKHNTDAAVSLCGPKSMMNDARRVAAKASLENGFFLCRGGRI
jgi:NAD(P)H-flavin reductase